MGVKTAIKQRLEEWNTNPSCPDCGTEMESFIKSYICRPCGDQRVAAWAQEKRDAEARRFSAAVLASPEYKALQDRITVLEIAVGEQYLNGKDDEK